MDGAFDSPPSPPLMARQLGRGRLRRFERRPGNGFRLAPQQSFDLLGGPLERCPRLSVVSEQPGTERIPNFACPAEIRRSQVGRNIQKPIVFAGGFHFGAGDETINVFVEALDLASSITASRCQPQVRDAVAELRGKGSHPRSFPSARIVPQCDDWSDPRQISVR